MTSPVCVTRGLSCGRNDDDVDEDEEEEEELAEALLPDDDEDDVEEDEEEEEGHSPSLLLHSTTALDERSTSHVLLSLHVTLLGCAGGIGHPPPATPPATPPPATATPPPPNDRPGSIVSISATTSDHDGASVAAGDADDRLELIAIISPHLWLAPTKTGGEEKRREEERRGEREAKAWDSVLAPSQLKD